MHDLSYEWDTCTDSCAVILVVLFEEMRQHGFFEADAAIEKPPEYTGIYAEADNVAHDELGTQTPVEEAKIRRVSNESIDTGRDEDMGISLVPLNFMVEALACLEHSEGPDRLSDDDQYKPEGEKDGAGMKRSPVP